MNRLVLVVFSIHDSTKHEGLIKQLKGGIEVTAGAVLIGLPTPVATSTRDFVHEAGLSPTDSIVFFDVTDSDVFPFSTSTDLSSQIHFWRLSNGSL
jgi:hypothetical protein